MSFWQKILKTLRRESPMLRRMYHRKQYPGLSISEWAEIKNEGVFDYAAGADIQSGVLIEIPHNGHLRMGANTFIARNTLVSPSSEHSIEIQEQATVQERGILLGNITIGRYSLLAPGVFIQATQGHHFSIFPHWLIRDQDNYAVQNNLMVKEKTRVVIEEDCWIGVSSVIMGGVTIGKGSVIGANSVVTKDIPPYSIAVGSPAKVIKHRLDFVPPPVIDAARETDLPYFYQGCKVEQHQQETYGTETEGILAYKSFVLALQTASPQRKIWVKMRSLKEHISVRCGNTTHSLMNEIQPYCFDVAQIPTPFFSFEVISHTSTLAIEDPCVQIQQAWVES